MPIPGDNGNPKEEREAWAKRIEQEGFHGADVVSDVCMIGQPPKQKNIFGVM